MRHVHHEMIGRLEDPERQPGADAQSGLGVTLRAARDGGSVALMAQKLAVSERVVRTRLWSAIGKTGARTRADAIQIAELNGWLAD